MVDAVRAAPRRRPLPTWTRSSTPPSATSLAATGPPSPPPAAGLDAQLRAAVRNRSTFVAARYRPRRTAPRRRPLLAWPQQVTKVDPPLLASATVHELKVYEDIGYITLLYLDM